MSRGKRRCYAALAKKKKNSNKHKASRDKDALKERRRGKKKRGKGAACIWGFTKIKKNFVQCVEKKKYSKKGESLT